MMNIIIGILLGMTIPAALFIGLCIGVSVTKAAIKKKEAENDERQINDAL